MQLHVMEVWTAQRIPKRHGNAGQTVTEKSLVANAAAAAAYSGAV
jgi:hypothetical protein